MSRDFTRQMLEQLLLPHFSKSDVQERIHAYAHPYRELIAYYRCAMMHVETKFNILDEELSLEYDRNPIVQRLPFSYFRLQRHITVRYGSFECQTLLPKKPPQSAHTILLANTPRPLYRLPYCLRLSISICTSSKTSALTMAG